ncbi:SusC/RagA family TonB-linked outer membrane protein [Pontibacter anaerobius]|uniref:TonB-dependent receptor n=1 Tax=Pontibacter anaerobius TaxID=2993940 RepID=A0ABT3RDQ4_9BACT|nr:TonB-dependent receptor [Pontibacter anaerobius]MCX2739895.1 TonB-dependent receptor [Pontibacter anaerobius]
MKKELLLSFLMIFALMTSAWAQAQTVSGRVTAASDGSILPGVTVLEKGTTNGITTDANGEYRLNVQPNATLVFRFIGMTTQEVPVNGRATVDVQLRADEKQLQEVVVVGYGTQEKRDVTGSVASVSGEDLENVPTPSLESALQGRAAGVQIESGSGKVGQGIKVRIRGSASVTASNQPLYVVDGIPITSDNQGIANNEPTNPLADLDPNDIESIDILKDASSASIYGSRASNGVVIITTKKGRAGKTNFNVGYSAGVSKATNKVDFLNGPEYSELLRESFERSSTIDFYINDLGFFADVDDAMDYFIPEWRNPVNSNWQDEVFRNGSYQEVNVSASGGNEKTTFYVGGSYNDQEGILIGNAFERISGRINLDHKASDKITVGANFSLARSENNRVANDNAFATPLQIVALAPIQPILDPETGELNPNTIYYNGLIEARDAFDDARVYRNISKVYGALNITPKLTFRSEFGLDLLNQEEESYQGRQTQGGEPVGGLGEMRNVNVVNYTTNNFFNYNTEFGDIHSLDGTVGMSYQRSNTNATYVSGQGFPNDDFKKLASASDITSGSSSGTANSLLSYFARANYKLYDRYLFSLSARVDGSSRFGADNKYGVFPAIGLGWIVSDEAFMQGVDFLSFLKLKTSYGITGNQEIGNFDSRGLYSGISYAGTSGIIPISVENPDLQWETTKQFDAGVSFGLFNDRISGTVDYYQKNTEDLLLNVQVPSTTGFTSITKNVGKLENKGWEVSLTTQNLTGDFSWSTTLNYARNRNEITDLQGQVIRAGAINRAVEGQPIGVFFTKKYAGVDPQTGDALYYLNAESDETTTDYGAAEEQVVGDPNPDFQGGLLNNFSFKGFDLSVLLQFVSGNEIYNNAGRFQSANMDYLDNQTSDQLDRWQQPGDITDVPEARFLDGNGTATSSRWIYDGSYLRGKNLTLGYTLPKDIAGKAHMSSVRVYLTAQNFFTITDYPGWDPEVNTQGTGPNAQRSNIGAGTDFYTAPQAKTLAVGVNFGF